MKGSSRILRFVRATPWCGSQLADSGRRAHRAIHFDPRLGTRTYKPSNLKRGSSVPLAGSVRHGNFRSNGSRSTQGSNAHVSAGERCSVPRTYPADPVSHVLTELDGGPKYLMLEKATGKSAGPNAPDQLGWGVRLTLNTPVRIEESGASLGCSRLVPLELSFSRREFSLVNSKMQATAGMYRRPCAFHRRTGRPAKSTAVNTSQGRSWPPVHPIPAGKKYVTGLAFSAPSNRVFAHALSTKG